MGTDRLTVQMVVAFIGSAGLIIIAGLIVLAYMGRDIPEPLSTLGGTAIGALGTLLARTSTQERRQERQEPLSQEPLAVEVRNPSFQPIPVEPAESVTAESVTEDGMNSK